MKTKSLLLSLIFVSGIALAQQPGERRGPAHVSNYNTWAIGLNLGHLYFWGDFSTNPLAEDGNFGIGLSTTLQKQMSPTLGVRSELTIGRSGGVNTGFIKGGAYFRTTVVDGNVMLMANLSNAFMNGNKLDRKWNHFFGFGFGASTWGATTYRSTDDVVISDVSRFQIHIPFEFSSRYRLNEKMDLNFGINAKPLWHDDFDGVSYVDNLESLYFLKAGVVFKLGNKARSAEWTDPLDDMYFEVQEIKSTIDGMSNDADGDGVADRLDEDDNTPAGVAVDGAGRALDVDMDGVPDHLDVDPFTPKGAIVDENGREMDSDGDGVADSRDMEENTPKGALVNFQGREIKTSGGISASLPSVYFDFNSAKVSYANYERLSTLARVMKQNSSLRVTVIGNTDHVGGEDANMRMGELRAKAVVDHMTKIYGISADRFDIVSRGEAELLTKDIQRVNRRVDFEVAK